MGCVDVEPFAKRRGTPILHRFELLAIDPGTHTGWAIFFGKSKSLCGCGLGSPPIMGADRVIIEIPQVYPAHPVPPNDLITLAFLAGRYAGLATCQVSTVFPHQWKGNLSKENCAARARFRLSPEEKKVVDDLDVPAKQLHNVMDAIGIGLFALGREI
jgi:hypothetical protein